MAIAKGVRINGNTYRCNSRILRKQLQDNAMSDEEITVRCRDEKRLARLSNLHNERLAKQKDKISEVTIDQIRAMYREDGAFAESRFIVLASALLIDDHWTLTQRPFVNNLFGIENDAYHELFRITSDFELPIDYYKEAKCVLSWARSFQADPLKCPSNLQPFVSMNDDAWSRVFENLCSANQLIKIGGKFLVDRPTTVDMIFAAEHRQREHDGAIDTLFHEVHGHHERRIEAHRRIEAILSDMKSCKKPGEYNRYTELDMDWQVAMVADNELQVKTMFLVTKSMRKTLNFVQRIHRRESMLGCFEPDADFCLSFDAWWKRWREFNTKQVEKISALLKARATEKEDIRQITNAMNQETINNVKAVSNALERHRGNLQVHYEGVRSLIESRGLYSGS